MVLMQHMHLPLDGLLPEAGPPLPARLLGAARLCSLTAPEQLTRLPIATADAQPLSPANERRALALLARACEAKLPEHPEEGPEAAVEGGAGLSHGAKRPRRAADRPRERRGGIAREFRARHVRVVRLALDEIRRRGAELVDK